MRIKQQSDDLCTFIVLYAQPKFLDFTEPARKGCDTQVSRTRTEFNKVMHTSERIVYSERSAAVIRLRIREM